MQKASQKRAWAKYLPGISGGITIALPLVLLALYVFHRIGDGQDSYARSLDGRRFDFGPVVSPETGAIVFASLQTGRGDLYALDENGQNLRRLTSDPAYEGEPVLSPDGKRIAYRKETPQAFSINVYKGQVWIMDVDGSHQKTVTQDQYDYSGAMFRRDGKALYLLRRIPDLAVARHEMFYVALDGTNKMSSAETIDAFETQSAFHESYFTQCDAKTKTSFVWLRVNGKHGEPERTVRLHEGRSPELSLDGKNVAFLSDVYNRLLWVAPTDGKPARQLLRSKNFLSNLAFSRDGRFIYFHEADWHGPVAIARIALDGSQYAQVARTGKP